MRLLAIPCIGKFNSELFLGSLTSSPLSIDCCRNSLNQDSEFLNQEPDSEHVTYDFASKQDLHPVLSQHITL